MDKTEFERIAERYAPMLYQIAFNYLKNREDSEDAVQNTLIRLFRYQKPFKSEEHIKAWLIRVNVNESKRIFSKSKQRDEICIDKIADKLYTEDHQARELFIELMRLKPQYSTALFLYYYVGYKTNEIASVLGKSEANVRAILSRARRQLKQQMEVDYDESNESGL